VNYNFFIKKTCAVSGKLIDKSKEVIVSMKRKMKKVLTKWQLYFMMLPAVIYVILFEYKPLYGIQIAFRNFNFKGGITGSPWVGFENFERLFNSYWFPIILKNTLTINFLSILVAFPVAIIFALIVNEVTNVKAKNAIQILSYAPHFISVVVVCGMVIMFLNPTSGIINHFIRFFGGDPVAFMQSSAAFKWIYVFSGMWTGTGWSAIIYFAALAGVDKSLLEAAEIDGAGRLKRIWYINIPVLIPTIVIRLIMAVGSMLGLGSQKVLLLQTMPNLAGSEVISTYVYKVGLERYDYSFSTAAGIFNSVCNVILLVTVNTICKKLTEESLW